MKNNVQCKICNNIFENNKMLSTHIRFKHKITTQEYYDTYLKTINEGICACPGCSNLTRYYKLTCGYAKYCSNKCQSADPLIKEKIKQTMIKKYGASNNFTRKEIIAKAHTKEANEKKRQRNLNKYGVEHVLQAQDIINKSKQTNLLKYGVEYGCITRQCREKANSKEAKDKKIQTFSKHFNAKGNLGRLDVWQKTNNSNIKHYGKHYLATNENRKKCNSLDARQKAICTKKKNNSLNSSSYEKSLAEFFKLHHISYINEYFDKNRYPYHCDFYLPNEDYFVELNIHWTHGRHFFDKNNNDDLIILDKWKEKSKMSKFYKTAINVWTKYDVKKYECAIKNKLNYIVLWNLNDIKQFKQLLEENYG